MPGSRRHSLVSSLVSSGAMFISVAAPQSCFADCASETRTIAARRHPDGSFVVTIPAWTLGKGILKDGVIVVSKDGTGSFDAQVETKFTSAHDSWHFHLTLTGDDGDGSRRAPEVLDANWLSPVLSDNDAPQIHRWHESFRVDYDRLHGAMNATIVSCC